MKKGDYVWTKEADASFEIIKEKLSETPVLTFPNLDKLFQVDSDVSDVGIGAVLSQEDRLIAYFSEKLNDARMRYLTYDIKLYAIVQALQH